jgi:hypothetical protein
MGDRRVLVVLVLVLGVISQWAVAGSARATECPNEQLRAEQPYGLTLPDCRAYELVSPIYKADNDIIFGESRASISDQAPAITYISPGTFAEPKAAQLYDRYVSREGPDGWLTQNITPVYSSFGENELTPAFKELLFTPDLSEGIVKSEHTPLLSGEPAGHINYYVADIGSGTYQLVTLAHSPIEKLYAGPVRPGVYAVGASTDLTHVFFGDQGNLTSSSEVSEGYHLYEWVDGTLSLVDVPPPGMEFRAQDTLGAGYATQLGGPETTGGIDAWHAVSADGTRAFFTAGEGEERKEAAGQVFVRENPEQPQSPYVGGKCAVSSDACTVELSASQRTDCNVQRKIKEPGFVCTGAPEPDPNDHAEPTNGDPHGLRPARYWSASADGSRVFFTSAVELTDDANTGPDDNASNLYEYDVENGMLTDLTVDTNPEDPAGAAVLGVATASEDGSYVYFVAEGRLTSVENAESEKPVLGKPNRISITRVR